MPDTNRRTTTVDIPLRPDRAYEHVIIHTIEPWSLHGHVQTEPIVTVSLRTSLLPGGLLVLGGPEEAIEILRRALDVLEDNFHA